ncbi:MFS transporter [Marinobacter sp.]|uniref:MFS transporter n=1 Tax=Marinobacter sp. TaxID=50741 RepID=UPI002D7FE05A|nr:MFS transporter [Marinobacter sp.]
MNGGANQEEQLASLAVVLPLALAGFSVSAACWTLFAVAGVQLRTELNLSSLQFGLLLAMPMAVSALLAIPAGLAARRVGARRVMLACLAGLSLCMGLLLMTTTFTGYLAVAGGLGLAGGFYSAGLQFVTSHCKPERLGLALGVFGAGVMGAGLNYYLVPLLHEAFSWRGVPLVYLIVLLLVMALLMMLTDDRDANTEPSLLADGGRRIGGLARWRAWHLCGYFGVLAGGFFALALWLPEFLSGQFGLRMASAANLALWFVVPGALAQVVGGALSDRYGSVRVVTRSLLVGLLALVVLSYPPMTLRVHGVASGLELEFALALGSETAFVVMLGVAMGCAIGSLQRMVIIRNRDRAALMAGLLLVSACSVAFLLPVLFGAVNQWLGVRSAMFMILFLLMSVCLVLFARANRREERQRLLHPGIQSPYPLGGRGGL